MIAVGNDRIRALDQLSEAYDKATSPAMKAHIESEIERVRRDYEFLCEPEDRESPFSSWSEPTWPNPSKQ